MNDLKITIDQLKNYLNTGLKMGMKDHKIDYVGREIDTMIGLHQWDKSGQLWCVLTEGGSKPAPSQVQPICYRLSDLDKFIPELGFCPKDEFFIRYGGGVIEAGKSLWKETFTDNVRWSPVDTISFGVVQLLFQWHFWPFGEEYFEKGLVIDKLKEVSNG